MLKSKGLAVVAVLLAGTASACAHEGHQHHHAEASDKKVAYGCPMCPGVRQEKPGNCPKCGMKLEPV